MKNLALKVAAVSCDFTYGSSALTFLKKHQTPSIFLAVVWERLGGRVRSLADRQSRLFTGRSWLLVYERRWYL